RGGPARPDLHGAHPGGRRDPTVRPPKPREATRAAQGDRRPVRIRRPERLSSLPEGRCGTRRDHPLVVTKDGRVVAGDAKLVIDDNAEYRHPEYANLDQDRTPLEQE